MKLKLASKPTSSTSFIGRLEIGIGFARKTDDEIGRNRNVGTRLAQPADDRFVFEHGVAALHRRQHAVGARLHRQMHVAHQLRQARVGVDQALGEFLRVRGRVADALDAGNFGDVFEQQREIGDARIAGACRGRMRCSAG